MADVVSKEIRSKNMAAIRGKDTWPEMLVRRLLHQKGFRYRLHSPNLPGKPDLVFPKYNAVIFVNGCFWHGHDCYLFKWPKTREGFWREKIGSNVKRDAAQLTELRNSGWRVGVVWECAVKGRRKTGPEEILGLISDWLLSEEPGFELSS